MVGLDLILGGQQTTTLGPSMLGLGLTLGAGGGYPYPPPSGFRWQLETYNGDVVTYGGQPCYYLERVY